MRITFSCPSCDKSYDLPLSLAGKKARCKKCSAEFVIPAPVEGRPPRSSEAIPVAAVLEPPPTPEAPTVRSPQPEPAPPRPAVPEPVDDDEGDSDDDAWPEYALATPEPKPVPTPVEAVTPPGAWPTRAASNASSPKVPGASPPKPRKSGSNADLAPRPRWFVPAVVGGSSAIVFLVNFTAFLAFSKLVPTVPEAQVAQAELKPKPRQGKPAEAAPVRPAVVAASPVEAVVPDSPMSSSDIVARYEASVALIKGKHGTGTGFIVKPGILATNAHVINGERARDLEVRFPSADKNQQGPFAAKILFQDQDRDLALLGVTTNLPPVRIAEGYKFKKGEDVTVIGNPGVGGQLILENAISRGLVSSMATLNSHSFLQLSISINPGNSGGPVFDTKGRVIGVVTLKTTKQEGLAFAVPVEDLITAIDTAGTIAGFAANGPEAARPDAPADTSPPKGNAPTLAYAWKQGETYVYSFDLTLDAGAALLNLKGNSIYRVKSVDGAGITLGHRGWYVQTKRSKDGKVLPGGTSNPTVVNEIEVKIDPQGEVLSASGSSSLPLLGDFSMLLIEPLPDDPQRIWKDSKLITLNEIEQVPGSGGGIPKLGRPGANNMPGGSLRQRIEQRRGGSRIGGRQPAPQPSAPSVKVTAHEATEETTYTLGERKGSTASIRKDYELATKEMVGNEPRLTMTGQGTIPFDLEAGIPLGLDYKLNVVENSGNATFRLPISVRCKLLSGKEKEESLQPPVYTPTAMNPINSGDLARLVTDLKSADANRRREACKTLYDCAPIENKRPEVSRVLERLVKDNDMGTRSDVIKAMGIWGDKKIAASLVASLADPKFGCRDEIFEALVRISPTEATAEAIVPWLAKDRGPALKAIKAIGSPAEGPLLKAAEQDETDKQVRIESFRLLKELGTSQSIPALQKLAKLKQDADLGRSAEDAINRIKKRWPSDGELQGFVTQLRSPNGGKRREAAERLSECVRSEERQPEIARALEKLVGDVDGWAQSSALKALLIWGDEKSRQPILDRLEDPEIRPYREAIEVLAKLKPDEKTARAIASRMKKDRRAAIEALEAMGPIAEPAALDALNDAGKDISQRIDVIKLLGKIGTDASIAVLQEIKTGREAGEAQRSLKDIQDRLAMDDSRIKGLVSDLKSGDRGRRSQVIQKLVNLKPVGSSREQVARALDACWEVDDVFIKRQLRDAVVRWGDAKSADFLAEHLADPDFKQWEEAMHTLATLRPDAKTGEVLVAHFQQNGNLVGEIARKMPTFVDRPLLDLLKKETDPRVRHSACNALANCGTPAALNDLQALARKAGDAEIASSADDALKAIMARQ